MTGKKAMLVLSFMALLAAPLGQPALMLKMRRAVIIRRSAIQLQEAMYISTSR